MTVVGFFSEAKTNHGAVMNLGYASACAVVPIGGSPLFVAKNIIFEI
jgi:hypothetical protein